MTKDQFKSFLDEIRTDPQFIKQLSDHEWTKDELADIACQFGKEHGHSLTADEFHTLMTELDHDRVNKTDQTAAAISDLSEEELGDVAGGKDHIRCEYSFKDRENCWSQDGCDHNHNHYDDYWCHHNDQGKHCGTNDAMKCDSMFTPCAQLVHLR